MTNFKCSTRQEGPVAVVSAAGEVDLAVVNQLWDKISAQICPAAVVVLDCADVTFMDSMGLQVLVRARNHAEKQHATFALAAVPKPVSRVLRLVGLDHVFPQFSDVEAAAIAHSGQMS
ncbi:hypothetical protein GCM10009839_59210 [Catenulispora yoronensis]|uniref:Anti-sigma factor antagonist n=1 Tax=Catenulispora yoronensis TaxID=450799 RepID=A0ABN2UZR3_9ACTN